MAWIWLVLQTDCKSILKLYYIGRFTRERVIDVSEVNDMDVMLIILIRE